MDFFAATTTRVTGSTSSASLVELMSLVLLRDLLQSMDFSASAAWTIFTLYTIAFTMRVSRKIPLNLELMAKYLLLSNSACECCHAAQLR